VLISCWIISVFVIFLFLYKTLVKNSLPTKLLLELIYTQNVIAFTVKLALDCILAGASVWVATKWPTQCLFEAAKRSWFRPAYLHVQVIHKHILCSLLEMVAFEVLTEFLSIRHLAA